MYKFNYKSHIRRGQKRFMTRSTVIYFPFMFFTQNHSFKFMKHSLSLKNYQGWEKN